MSEEIRELVALIRAHHRRLESVYRSVERALDNEIVQLGRTSISALIFLGPVERPPGAQRTEDARVEEVELLVG